MKTQRIIEKTTLTAVLMNAAVRNFRRGIALMLLLLCIAASAQAQKARATTNTKKQDTDAAMLETLKAMQKELGEIKVLLAARPVQPTPQAANPPAAMKQEVALDLSDRPFLGDKNAPVTMVEITDYQCPFCARHARETLPQIVKDYIANGKVKYYVLDLPLESIHPNAFKAAVATRCAGEQGKYWESHEWLFANQNKLTDWNAQAATLGLDAEKFTGCVSGDKYTNAVRKDIQLAQTIGVSGTPGFFFATGGGVKITTTSFVNGARPFFTMKEQIDTLLAQKPAKPQAVKAANGGIKQ